MSAQLNRRPQYTHHQNNDHVSSVFERATKPGFLAKHLRGMALALGMIFSVGVVGATQPASAGGAHYSTGHAQHACGPSGYRSGYPRHCLRPPQRLRA